MTLWLNQTNTAQLKTTLWKSNKTQFQNSLTWGVRQIVFHPQHRKICFLARDSTYPQTKELWSQMCCQAGDWAWTGRGNTEPEAQEDIYSSCFEYYLHVHMHVCVCVCVRMSDWPGFNSSQIARQLNISRETQMCRSGQKGLRWSHNFICQMSMKLNDFRNT